MIDRQGCILLIYKMNNTAFQIIVEYRTKYSNKIIFYVGDSVLFYLSNISLEVGESKREPFMIWIRVKNRQIYD